MQILLNFSAIRQTALYRASKPMEIATFCLPQNLRFFHWLLLFPNKTLFCRGAPRNADENGLTKSALFLESLKYAEQILLCVFFSNLLTLF